MSNDHTNLSWASGLDPGKGPLYLQIVDAMETAVEKGELQPGQRLPPQRQLARYLGVDLTTVTRAYTTARHRRLLDAVTGRGSFVAIPNVPSAPAFDLSMNIPPAPTTLRLSDLIDGGIREILKRTQVEQLMSYHAGTGSLADRSAGAAWLEPVMGRIPGENVILAPGAQAALAAILAVETRPGDVVLADSLTYPGFIHAATLHGIRIVPVSSDETGMMPDALDAACQRYKPRLIYLMPTMHNPTGVTMPFGRRKAIAAVARARKITILEDDPYAMLASTPVPAIAALAPEHSYHLSTVAKCMIPGLRVAFIIPPNEETSAKLADALHALTIMTAPLMSALLTLWIRNGTAHALRDAVRIESAQRQALARAILPANARGHPEGLHVWQPLPLHWSHDELSEVAHRHGLGVTGADAFHVGSGPVPDAVRISLGAMAQRSELEAALRILAALIEGQPQPQHAISDEQRPQDL